MTHIADNIHNQEFQDLSLRKYDSWQEAGPRAQPAIIIFSAIKKAASPGVP